MPTDKDRAIELARQVYGAKNLGLSLLPSQAMLIATEFLRALYLLPEQRTPLVPRRSVTSLDHTDPANGH